VAGAHRSPYRGFSIEFAEHREYAPGDDLRYLDWKVFGRTDKYYLKQFEDETNLICYLILDGSESMTYRGPESPLSKLEYAQCLAASMAWLVLQQQDAVALATFDSEPRQVLQESGSATQMQQIIQVLERIQPQPKTNVGPVFHDLAERLRRRGVVVVFSDLFDDPARVLAGLQHFRHRRHDVILFHVLDAAEIDFPFRRPTLFRGMEADPNVTADPRALRKAYLREFGNYCDQLMRGCRAYGIEYIKTRTDQPLDAALSNFLSSRMARIK